MYWHQGRETYLLPRYHPACSRQYTETSWTFTQRHGGNGPCISGLVYRAYHLSTKQLRGD